MRDTMLMVLDNAALQVSLTPKAEELKVAALESSALVGKVDNAKQQEIAVAAQSELDSVIRLTEKARKQIKQPVIELGRKIDTQAESFIKELTEERGRVTMLIANFQAAEIARVRAAEVAARLEAERIERERQAEMRRIQEAQEAERRNLKEQEMEALRQAQSARNEQERIEARRLQAELDRQRELSSASNLEAMDAVHERFNAQSEVLSAKPVAAAAKAEGQVVRQDWEIAVTDPFRLAKFHPQCVTITAKVGEIKQLLQQGISVNGVTATPIVKTSTRAASRNFIEV